jgi:hypothetical protein
MMFLDRIRARRAEAGGADVVTETTEQALARVEAECGWSDAFVRLAEAGASRSGEAVVGSEPASA